MPAIEWVSLYIAATRLAGLWKIPQSIAEEIVQNVVEGGKIDIRGSAAYQQVPKIITGKIRFFSKGLFVSDFSDVEIDWNGLVEEGSKLIPSWIRVWPRRRIGTVPNKLTPAKRKAQRRGPLPGAIDRYNDEALFPDIDRMTVDERMSVHAAALKLAYAGKVEGIGSKESCARRLAKRYREKRNSLPLAPTHSH
jgi:hypothetical protein